MRGQSESCDSAERDLAIVAFKAIMAAAMDYAAVFEIAAEQATADQKWIDFFKDAARTSREHASEAAAEITKLGGHDENVH
jgi:hypothetical protein